MQAPREWFTDESFWSDLYPVMFPDRSFIRAGEEVPSLIKLAGVRGKRVLDLCCGPGRFAVPLARNGFRVTGVDRTAYLLNRGLGYAEKNHARVEFVQADMRAFVRPGAFDIALNMFTSFGYFADPEDDLRVLRNLAACLRPGGALVLDVLGKETLATRFQPISYDASVPGVELIQRHEVIDDWTRLRNEWLLIRDEQVRRFKFELRIYSGQELRDRLAAAGFASVELYGDITGAPYDQQAKRLFAVAKTPDARRPGHGKRAKR